MRGCLDPCLSGFVSETKNLGVDSVLDKIQDRKDDVWMNHACWVEVADFVADGSMVAVVDPVVDLVDSR